MKIKNTTNIIGRKAEKCSIIIPAAGMGRRMRSYGPKSLIKITAQKTIIQNQLEIIKENFVSPEIILVCGFEAEKLMRNTPEDIIKVENESYEDTNDLVFNPETIKNLKLNSSCLVVDSSDTMNEDEVGCNISNNYIEQMLPDIENKWAQIAFLIGEELSLFKKVAWDKDKSHYFGFEAINEVIGKGGRFKSVSPSGMKITDVDSSKDLSVAREIL